MSRASVDEARKLNIKNGMMCPVCHSLQDEAVGKVRPGLIRKFKCGSWYKISPRTDVVANGVVAQKIKLVATLLCLERFKGIHWE
jgi:hypothetical protein